MFKKSYSIYKSKGVKIAKGLKKLAKEYDNIGYMSKELGKELESLYSDSNYAVGIHRTGYTVVNEEFLWDIFNNGLINNGDAMQGIENHSPSTSKTVSFFNYLILYGQLKVVNGYKESQGALIVKIPKSYLGMEDGEVKPIYYHEYASTFRLLPEYIYGYVEVKDGRCEKIIRNPNYKDIHDYQNDGLVYDKDVNSESIQNSNFKVR